MEFEKLLKRKNVLKQQLQHQQQKKEEVYRKIEKIKESIMEIDKSIMEIDKIESDKKEALFEFEKEQREKGLELYKGKWITEKEKEKQIIEDNLKRVEEGESLEIPLSQLGTNFKIEYMKESQKIRSKEYNAKKSQQKKLRKEWLIKHDMY